MVNPLLNNKPSGYVYKNHSAGEDLCKCDFATLRETKWYYNMKIAEMNIFLFSRKGAKALRIRTLIPSTGDQRYPYFVYIIRLYPVVPTINLIKSREMAMDFV